MRLEIQKVKSDDDFFGSHMMLNKEITFYVPYLSYQFNDIINLECFTK